MLLVKRSDDIVQHVVGIGLAYGQGAAEALVRTQCFQIERNLILGDVNRPISCGGYAVFQLALDIDNVRVRAHQGRAEDQV